MAIHKRFVRYSLRRLFLVVLLAAIPMAWVAKARREYSAEQQAILTLQERINESGDAIVVLEKGEILGCGTGVRGIVETAPKYPSWFCGLAETLRLPSSQRTVSVWLSGPEFDDAAVPHLVRLSHLESMNIAYTDISPHGVDELKRAFPDCKIYEAVEEVSAPVTFP